MRYKNDYMKVNIVVTDTDRVAIDKSNYLDFYIYCDSTGSVYKMTCFDYAVRYNYNKGVETLGHRPIDFDYDRVNIIVVKDDNKYTSNITHYMTIINVLEDLKLELKRNINMKVKVLEIGNKYSFEVNYYEHSR